MIIQLQSDLHTEMYYGSPWDMLKSLEFHPNLDVLLLAGDIVSIGYQDHEEVKAVFDYLSTKAKHVIYIAGNHEYYGHLSKHLVNSRIKMALPSNFTFLENDEITIEGQQFFGGTLWFRDDPLNFLYEKSMNDVNIPNIKEWVYQSNNEFREKGSKLITPNTIVISHHLPSSVCTNSMYKGSPINRFFVSEETGLIFDNKPKLWVAGHTHIPVDTKLEDTRIVINPYGYPKEHKFFKYTPVIFEV